MADTTLEERMDRLEARWEIAERLAGYAHGCDKRDAARFMEIWHDDATWSLPDPFGTSRGTEQIRAALGRIWDANAASHHWMTNLVLEFAGRDRARALSDAVCVMIAPDGRHGLVAATYESEFMRRQGSWRIANCDVTVHWNRRWATGG